MPKTNLLFICSRNQWRSPTAESLLKGSQDYEARSAGTEPSSRIHVSEKMIKWADVIFVMEKKHKQRLMEKFSFALETKPVHILDIPDDYQFMDPELLEILKTALAEYLEIEIR